MLYVIFEELCEREEFKKCNLQRNKSYRYLRLDENTTFDAHLHEIKTNNNFTIEDFKTFCEEYEFTPDQVRTIYSIVATIILLGEIEFTEDEFEAITVVNEDTLEVIAELLGIDCKQLSWSLTNYCLVNKGIAYKKQQTLREAEGTRDVLAGNLYSKLVDYVVAVINHKLSYGIAIL